MHSLCIDTYGTMHALHTNIILFFFSPIAFPGISLSWGKMSVGNIWPATKIYSPASKKRCRDIVSPQSSVKINQISLDESGEHVGICSEDGKVRSRHSSPLVTGPWEENRQSVVFIFHNLSSDSYNLISFRPYANDLELEGVNWGTSSINQSINLEFYLHIYTHLFYFFC